MLYYITGREKRMKLKTEGTMETRRIDWKGKTQRARKMRKSELEYAIKDCMEAIKAGVDGGYYTDEVGIYRKELKRRMK